MVLIIFVVAIIFAHYMIRRDARRREEMHEHRMERFNRLMDRLKKLNSDQNVQESDTTGAEKKS